MRFTALCILLAGFVAVAQDRCVRESAAVEHSVRVYFQPDGGCVIEGCATSDGETACYAVSNRALCGNAPLKTAARLLGKRALGLGDGGVP